ncbi:alpha/beta hydrolase family protein [Haliangium sp.]|uniref:alpha/beta hydrolase family protein n=1 Tax=Haliangium sp. TaxID=2663208 RepID=UPI003D0DBD45
MCTRPLTDGPESFDVTVLEAAKPSRVVLFAAGRGGNPQRHSSLLSSLAENGCTVVAPHFEMIAPMPADNDLLLRARRLTIALNAVADDALPVAGVGHSIGATMLLALAGAQMWMRAGNQLDIPHRQDFDRLVLLAPATDFVRVPGALDAVSVPILAWAGTQDAVTPPARIEFLKHAMGERTPVDMRVVEGAGHFSFMDSPPPQTTEPLADREAFLAKLAVEVGRYLAR